MGPGLHDRHAALVVDQAPPNFLEPDEGDTRLRRSYGEDKFRRLVTLKDTYDPRNVFTLNANIRPSVPAH